jgi:hypothetical protein
MSLAEGKYVERLDPEEPVVSDTWHKVRGLASSAIDPNRNAGADAVVRFLRDVDEPTWLQVVADAQSWNRYQAALLQKQPQREPDKIERAKKVSRLLYGLPWWLREAHFWRESNLDNTRTAETTPVIRGEAAQTWEE